MSTLTSGVAFKKSLLRLVFILPILMLFGYAMYSAQKAPCGDFQEGVGKAGIIGKGDPGSHYTGMALFFEGGTLDGEGHPGLPLTFALYKISDLYYQSVQASKKKFLPRIPFFAKKMRTLTTYFGYFMVLSHLLSFVAVYLFLKTLFKHRQVALASTLLYASTFPVLFYSDRVSVEPHLVLFSYAALYCFQRYRFHLDYSQSKKWLGWACVFSLCLVAAIFSKLHLAYALIVLPFFDLGLRLTNYLRAGKAYAALAKQCLLPFVFILLNVGAFGMFFVQKVPIQDFFNYWLPFWKGLPLPQERTTGVVALLAHAFDIVSDMAPKTFQMLTNGKFFNSASYHQLFLSAEWIMLLLCTIGVGYYCFRFRPLLHRHWPIVVFLIVGLPVVAWRNTFHYLFNYLPYACFFAGFIVYISAKKLSAFTADKLPATLIATVLCLAIHQTSISYFFQSKKQNIATFSKKKERCYYEYAMTAQSYERNPQRKMEKLKYYSDKMLKEQDAWQAKNKMP